MLFDNQSINLVKYQLIESRCTTLPKITKKWLTADKLIAIKKAKFLDHRVYPKIQLKNERITKHTMRQDIRKHND